VRQLLAVDGGQSAIRVRHSSLDHAVDVEGVSRLEGDTAGSVADAIVRGWRDAGAVATDRVVMGLTTAPTDGETRQRLCAMVAGQIEAPEVWLADDAVTGHAGALSLGPGISVIVGTGVACLAMSADRPARLIGGHGYLIGDEGGGFWIGSAGVRAVTQAMDGRGPATALVELADAHFGGLASLGDRLHSSARPVDTVARFAPRVLEAGAAGDAVAAAITDAAVDELVTLVQAAGRHAARADATVPLALGGRLLADGPLRERLDRALARDLPDIVARSADGSPLDGALLLGGSDEPGRYRDLVYVWGGAT